MIEAEQKVLQYLDRQGIPYQYVAHEPMYTIAQCEGIEELDEDTLYFKNLFLCNRQETDFYILVMPGSKKFKTSALSKQIQSSRLSFASDEKLLEVLNLKPGSVSPFGLLNLIDQKVTLLLDTALKNGEKLAFHPNNNCATLILRQEGFQKYLESISVLPVYVEL